MADILFELNPDPPNIVPKPTPPSGWPEQTYLIGVHSISFNNQVKALLDNAGGPYDWNLVLKRDSPNNPGVPAQTLSSVIWYILGTPSNPFVFHNLELYTPIITLLGQYNVWWDLQGVYTGVNGPVWHSYSGQDSVYYNSYNYPSIQAFTASRCLSDGTLNDDGAYIKVDLSALVTKCPYNHWHLKIEAKPTDGSTWVTYYDGADVLNSATYDTNQTDTHSVIIGNGEILMASAYEVRVTYGDDIKTSEQLRSVPISFRVFSLSPNEDGIAFGKVATQAGFDLAMPFIVQDPAQARGALHAQQLISEINTIGSSTSGKSLQLITNGNGVIGKIGQYDNADAGLYIDNSGADIKFRAKDINGVDKSRLYLTTAGKAEFRTDKIMSDLGGEGTLREYCAGSMCINGYTGSNVALGANAWTWLVSLAAEQFEVDQNACFGSDPNNILLSRAGLYQITVGARLNASTGTVGVRVGVYNAGAGTYDAYSSPMQVAASPNGNSILSHTSFIYVANAGRYLVHQVFSTSACSLVGTSDNMPHNFIAAKPIYLV